MRRAITTLPVARLLPDAAAGRSGTAPQSGMAALAGADDPPSMHVPTHRREPASRAAFREPVAGRILIGLHPIHPHGPPALPDRKPKT